jgi:hypothetical protein
MKHQYKSQVLHEKCLKILDLIATMEIRIQRSREFLDQYDRAGPMSIIRSYNTRENLKYIVGWNKAVHNRLVNYYNTTLSQIGFYAAKAKEELNELH